jgi:hypothetical protein
MGYTKGDMAHRVVPPRIAPATPSCTRSTRSASRGRLYRFCQNLCLLVAPIDGKEYADHHRAAKSQHAKSGMKKRNRLAHDDHGVAKRAKAARSSRVSSI